MAIQSTTKHKKLYLYWKVEWLRKLLSKFFFEKCYKDGGLHYIWAVIWNFITGYSLLDSFYYDHRTPKWALAFIKKVQNYVEI